MYKQPLDAARVGRRVEPSLHRPFVEYNEAFGCDTLTHEHGDHTRNIFGCRPKTRMIERLDSRIAERVDVRDVAIPHTTHGCVSVVARAEIDSEARLHLAQERVTSGRRCR